MNRTLYKKEMKGSFKLLLIFAGILTMYITMIVGMYDPDLSDAIRQFEKLMPDLMAAVGMTGGNDTLDGFLSSYLYGMIMIVFPMVYSIIRANGLAAKYVDRGSMASLLAAPVKRVTIAVTQLAALISGIVLLLIYCTVLEYTAAQIMFPGELPFAQLIRLNAGLLCLQLFIGAFCFLCSCIFNESKHSVAVSAGVTAFMYVLQMLANMGGKLENIKYATFFTLFRPEGLLLANTSAWIDAAVLFFSAVCFSVAAIVIFKRKEMQV